MFASIVRQRGQLSPGSSLLLDEVTLYRETELWGCFVIAYYATTRIDKFNDVI